ncbi:hypothetical protein [Candidatus Scalindua japonica]|nr:hypothetical protein [Candidatus Scalindua japonica]
MKRDDQTKGITVITLRENAMPDDIERGKTSGLRDYILQRR